ncbi:MAG: four helix bundle protein [Gemmatimonadales bacterium]
MNRENAPTRVQRYRLQPPPLRSSSVRDHTSLIAWQLARTVTRASLAAGRSHWKPWAAAIFWQLQRASLSVQLNIAEGYARRSRRAFLYQLNVAYGSAVERANSCNCARTSNCFQATCLTRR